MVIVLVLAWSYSRYGTTPTGGGILYGVEPVVVAVVIVALWQLGRTALKQKWFAFIGVAAIAAYFAGIDVLVPLAAGGLAVALVDNRRRLTGAHAWMPLLPVLPAATGRTKPGLVSVAAEFAKLGVTVFGSGYVLLAFLRADLVTQFHWLTERQVLDAVATRLTERRRQEPH
jgi:chromate transporter